MSNHIQASITIGVSTELEWLDVFINAIYAEGTIYAHPFGEPVKWGSKICLERSDAPVYFKKYIHQIREAARFSTRPPMLIWFVENIGYDVSIYCGPEHLQWVIYLPPNKHCKDEDCYYSDFEYYLLLLLKTMKDFPILAISTDEDCYADDLDWVKKEGKWWGLKVQVPQPKESFQMLDVIIDPPLSNAILQQLVKKASVQENQLFPVGFEKNTTQEIITQLANQTVHSLNWKYVCGHGIYDICISPMSESLATRLFFRTLVVENLPYVDLLVKDALELVNDHIILQFVSFDSRYNYFFT